MIFSELRFFVFFAVTFCVHWALRNHRARKVWLVLCSYFFYAAWDWRFLLLIWGSTLVDYVVGLKLARHSEPRRRKLWLLVSLVVNLGLLGVFKYYDFFVGSAVELSQWLGLDAWGLAPSEYMLGLMLPVGISFYTFQTLSYSIDVYRGLCKPTRDLPDLALFVGFFPQLVAGPIVRAVDFLPQLLKKPSFRQVDVRACLMLFLVGFLKKAVVSDGIAPFIDAYYADPTAYDAASAWIAVPFFMVLLYCDFSAYSDMAIASAGLLGYQLCINFNFPYFATSITEFWRRWHISLSTWLSDYIYIPLGGNRGSRMFIWRNLMITWLLGGLWHGADWRYVIFGGMMGVALIVHREWSRGPGPRFQVPVLSPVVGNLATMFYISLAMLIFRATDMANVADVFSAYVLFDTPGMQSLGDRLIWILPVLYGAHALNRSGWLANWWRPLPWPVFSVSYGFLAALVLSLAHADTNPFVYFQF